MKQSQNPKRTWSEFEADSKQTQSKPKADSKTETKLKLNGGREPVSRREQVEQVELPNDVSQLN